VAAGSVPLTGGSGRREADGRLRGTQMANVWRRAAVVALLFSIAALAWWDGDIAPEGARWDERLVPVKLYFAAPDASGVAPEIRWLPAAEQGPARILSELLDGPRHPGLSPSLPASTKVRSVTVEGDRAVVDFGGEIVRDHPGGSAGETITVYSVVNTLTELPAVRSVEWRVEGKRVETLAGHLDLSRPVKRNPDVIVDLSGRALHRSAGETGTPGLGMP